MFQNGETGKRSTAYRRIQKNTLMEFNTKCPDRPPTEHWERGCTRPSSTGNLGAPDSSHPWVVVGVTEKWGGRFPTLLCVWNRMGYVGVFTL